MAKQVFAEVAGKQHSLSQDQLQMYWDNGFILIKKLFDVKTINLFRDRFVEIVNMSDSNRFYSIVKDPKLYQQNVKPEQYVNKIQELLYDDVYSKYSEDPTLMHILSQIIGEDLTAINCMLINKPPGSQRHPPHQDLYYLPIRPADKIVATWTAIDHVHRDNGCLYMVPGSHKVDSMYDHIEDASEKKQFFLGIRSEDIVAPADKRVYLEMQPGDTVLFHPYIVHGSGPNTTQSCRKCMTAHYANSGCHYIDVRGTQQELIATKMETEIKRRGGECNFVDLWRMKGKQVQGVRSNL